MLVSILWFVCIVVSLLVLLLILIQDPQGEGGLFARGGSAFFHVHANRFLFRAVSSCVGIFLFSALALAWLNRSISYDDLVLGSQLETVDGEKSNQSLWFFY